MSRTPNRGGLSALEQVLLAVLVVVSIAVLYKLFEPSILSWVNGLLQYAASSGQ